MNDFTLKHVLLWGKDTYTYAYHDADSSKWLNTRPIASSTDELNIWFNENFYLLSVLEEGGILRLSLILDEMFLMSESVVKSLNTIFKQFYQ